MAAEDDRTGSERAGNRPVMPRSGRRECGGGGLMLRSMGPWSAVHCGLAVCLPLSSAAGAPPRRGRRFRCRTGTNAPGLPPNRPEGRALVEAWFRRVEDLDGSGESRAARCWPLYAEDALHIQGPAGPHQRGTATYWGRERWACWWTGCSASGRDHAIRPEMATAAEVSEAVWPEAEGPWAGRSSPPSSRSPEPGGRTEPAGTFPRGRVLRLRGRRTAAGADLPRRRGSGGSRNPAVAGGPALTGASGPPEAPASPG